LDVSVLKPPGPVFLLSYRKGDFLSKEEQVPLGDNTNTVCLISSLPNNYFRTLKYDTLLTYLLHGAESFLRS